MGEREVRKLQFLKSDKRSCRKIIDESGSCCGRIRRKCIKSERAGGKSGSERR